VPAFCAAVVGSRSCALASREETRIVGLMPEPRRIARYIIDVLLIFVPLSGMLYFLFNPAAFNAFLAWLVSVL
jgi:hypothetical protein